MMDNNEPNMYSVFLDKGLYRAEITMISGTTELIEKALIKTGSPLTLISHNTFERLNCCGETCEEVDIKLPGLLYPIGARKVLLDKFKLGTIDLGRRSVICVHNKKLTENIIGMDILSDLYFEHKAVSECLRIWKPE